MGVAGYVGGHGIWEKPASVPPTFLETHPCQYPPGQYLSHLPQVQCPEKRKGFRDNCFLSLLLPVRAGESGVGGLPQFPVVRVRAATSRLMSQQAFSQIPSLFSFLPYEMGIINEKQRQGQGGEVEGQSCWPVRPVPPLPSWNPMHSWTVLLTDTFSA